MDFTTWFFVVNFSIMQITSDEHVCFKLQVLIELIILNINISSRFVDLTNIMIT